MNENRKKEEKEDENINWLNGPKILEKIQKKSKELPEEK